MNKSKLEIERMRTARKDREISISEERKSWKRHLYEMQYTEEERYAHENIKRYLNRGNAADYFKFLSRYVELGGKPTHHYDYEFTNLFGRPIVYIAKNECKIFPLYGAKSIMVVMMPGCIVIDGDVGHNNFYRYDDILNQKYGRKVPTYSDW